jgi:hypothetical protein
MRRRHSPAPTLGPPGGQGGVILILVAVAMVAILAMGGLALDVSHMFLNKARLQNTVDAAALSAAKILDQTGDTARASATATSMMGLNASASGNRELGTAVSQGTLTVTVEFSSTLQPFNPGTAPAMYVRVRAQNFRLPAWLIPVIGINNKVVGASAVAGPSPTILQACNLVPLVVCGTPAAQGGTAPYWGFTPGAPNVLKTAAGQQSPIGPGNFQLLRLGGNGADVLRQNLAGGYEGCYDGSGTLATQPGNDVGPVSQGLNTRFNVYQGSLSGSQSTYPPDVVTRETNPALTYNSSTNQIKQGSTVITNSSQLNFNYSMYQSRVASGSFDVQPAPSGPGAFDRRVMGVPIADCSGVNNGQTNLPILGVGCFFLLQQMTGNGNNANIFGEFVSSCQTGGAPGPSPSNIAGPYVIQLYRNFQSNDS